MTLWPPDPSRLAGYATLAVWQMAGGGGGGGAVDARPHLPESIWPTSVAGWMMLVGVVYAVIKAYRAERKEVVAPLESQIGKAEQFFRGQIVDTRDHFDHALEELRTQYESQMTRQFDDFGRAIRGEMTGFGERIKRVENSQSAQDGFNDSVLRFMGQSETHRAALERQIVALAATVERQGEQMGQKMERILSAMVDLRGGRRQ